MAGGGALTGAVGVDGGGAGLVSWGGGVLCGGGGRTPAPGVAEAVGGVGGGRPPAFFSNEGVCVRISCLREREWKDRVPKIRKSTSESCEHPGGVYNVKISRFLGDVVVPQNHKIVATLLKHCNNVETMLTILKQC